VKKHVRVEDKVLSNRRRRFQPVPVERSSLASIIRFRFSDTVDDEHLGLEGAAERATGTSLGGGIAHKTTEFAARAMRDRISRILAKLVRNVKVLRKLKFHSDTRPRTEGMSGTELADESLDLGLNLGEGDDRGYLVDIWHGPVADPVRPTGEAVFHHRAMLPLVERDDEGGFRQVPLLDPTRFPPGQEARDRLAGKPLGRMVGEGKGLDVGTESPRFGAPEEPVPRGFIIEPGLRIPASVEVARAEEKDGLPIVHGANMDPLSPETN
jgi:hypothetical protein